MLRKFEDNNCDNKMSKSNLRFKEYKLKFKKSENTIAAQDELRMNEFIESL